MDTSIGEKIRILRQRLGMTQAELAAKSGLSERVIREAELGRRDLRAQAELLPLCLALDLAVDITTGHPIPDADANCDPDGQNTPRARGHAGG